MNYFCKTLAGPGGIIMESSHSRIIVFLGAVGSIIGIISAIVGLMVDLPDACEKYPKVCNYFGIQITDNGIGFSKVDNKLSSNVKSKSSVAMSSKKSNYSIFEKQKSLDSENSTSVIAPVEVTPSSSKAVNKYDVGVIIRKVKSCNLKMSDNWSVLKYQLSRYLKISENSSNKQFIEALDKKCAK